ncbi:MAG: type II secretion system F family protein [Proteobacteria bacterium]|nr:type II secretion system F family protein [Pseudomonadota bacterium]
MPIFKYKGYNSKGAEKTGTIEAQGRFDAISALKAKLIFPTDVLEVTKKPIRSIFQKKDDTFLPDLTRNLSMLLASGVQLMDALQSLSDEYTGYYGDLLVQIKERVSSGMSLHKALEVYGDFFPEYYINMVQAGETSGSLDMVLVKIADFLETQAFIKAKVRSATAYPLLMAGVSLLILFFLFSFVMPKIVRIFSETGGSLPFLTAAIIAVTNIVSKYWWAFIAIFFSTAWLLRKLFKKYRTKIDGIILKLPGNIIQSLYYARFARTMGALLEGGIPLLKALKLSAKSIGNRKLELNVLDSVEKVAAGQQMSSSLSGFPPLLLRLISTGEKSGNLAQTINRAALAYEQQFSRKIEKALSLFEPAMVLSMGVVVCIIVLAVLLPIFQMNQLVK